MTKQLPMVVTIDGPSGVGKGTIALLIAQKLGWHYLDSGVFYRVVAWKALQNHIQLEDHIQLKSLLQNLDIEIQVKSQPHITVVVIFHGEEITEKIRMEECSRLASQLAAIPFVRAALLVRQQAMRRSPGLITDGRDMGTVVFPDANVKFFFTADHEERAKRRHNQLKEKGINVSLRNIQEEMQARDRRDLERNVSPAKPASDAIVIDTTNLSIDEVLERVLKEIRART